MRRPLLAVIAIALLSWFSPRAALAQQEAPPETDFQTSDSLMEPAEVLPEAPEGEGTTITAAPPRAGEEMSRSTDILTMGGFFYQRAEVISFEGSPGDAVQPLLPALADVYLEAKPSDEMRGLVRGRLVFDPLDPVLSTTPRAFLTQFWFQFGVAKKVFVTVGRQNVKWGSARLWTVTDFLQNPNPDPLNTYDLRPGVDMVKVVVPWEEMASNLVVVATADLKGPAERPLRYGGAVRAEVALGVSELSLTAAFQQGRRPRYGVDWSLGLGPVDLHTELALVRDTGGARLWELVGTEFLVRPFSGPQLQASAGAITQFRLGDLHRAQITLEGFYNSFGYKDSSMLEWVRSQGDYRALYHGRAYGMAQVRIEQRSQFEPRTIVTLLTNLSDASGLVRLDAGGLVGGVTVMGFVEKPFGPPGSELLFEFTSGTEEPIRSFVTFRAGLGAAIRM
jgi:hypothetical protein